MTPEEIQARILYKDQDVIVLDKPPGLAVHAGPNSPDHLELYLPQLCFGWAKPPRLAHRLDRDTSGCLILGRHDKAISRLGKLFMAHRIGKAYWAVTIGAPDTDCGTIDAPLLKLTGKGGWRMVIDPAGQPAVTDWRVLGRGDGMAWIECVPRTGRTHQIRLHLKALGCPLRGDAYYGPDPNPPMRLHLHSRMVSIPPLSAGKPPIHAEAPPPDHMRAALAACGWSEPRP
ncbi:putative enzyme [Magnetospirillum sp. LM-5]|uniref:RluA family pseudouridine synthase n=1 Tax=Magnetospirillum sp. LM-5 TaxID=2681466 RepID=UPI0013846C2F|nr:RNA pseudouridine synthase [Magnetospirillum sp. LM-5]CAA7615639.1 putative enzyme [Magnetospirillum sp. LM-5]